MASVALTRVHGTGEGLAQSSRLVLHAREVDRVRALARALVQRTAHAEAQTPDNTDAVGRLEHVKGHDETVSQQRTLATLVSSVVRVEELHATGVGVLPRDPVLRTGLEKAF